MKNLILCFCAAFRYRNLPVLATCRRGAFSFDINIDTSIDSANDG